MSSNVSICQGSSLASLGGAMLNGTKAIIWSDNSAGGTFSPNSTTLKASWTPPKTFTGTAVLTLTATSGCTSSPASASFMVTVTPTPVATFSYPGTPYCSSDVNPLPVFSGGGRAGTFSSTSGLLFTNTLTGEVNLAASTAGIYTVTNTIAAVGGCSKVTSTSSITITASPSAVITYAGNPFCKSISTAQPVTRTGTSGGTYSAPSGLKINSSTGAITPNTSTAGTYLVTYTMPASGGCVAGTATTSVTITAVPITTFSYNANPYCSNASDPFPVFSGGGTAGVFSSTAGLVFVSTSTGQVDLSASTPGTYTVTNTIAAAGGCSKVTATNTITITAAPAAAISYPGSPYCKSLTSAQPVTRTGTSGGTYSSTSGLTLNSSTGAITPSSSTAGTYTVSYTIPASGGCGATVATASVTVTSIPSAPVINLVTQPTCSITTGSVLLDGLPSVGNWTITISPGGSTRNGTGSSTSITGLTAGTYSFTVTAGNSCTSVSSLSVTINSPPPNPSAPVIGTITQPTCAVPTGTVILSGLPSPGSWTVVRSPDNVRQTGTGSSATISSVPPGTYFFTVINSEGCSSPSSMGVTINAGPGAPSAPIIMAVTQPTCVISSGSVTLSGLPSTGTWTLTRNPDGMIITGSGSGITLQAISPGTWTFSVTGSNGCISPASSPVTINPQPSIPVAPYISSVSQPTCILSTGAVSLTGLPSGGTWTLTLYPGGISNIGTGTSYVLPGLQPGIYNFTVTSDAGCTSVPSSNAIVSAQPPTPGAPLIGTVTQPTLDVPSGSVVLNGLPVSGSWTIARKPDNSIVTGSGTTFMITGLPEGNFTFTVTNSSGCTSTESDQIQITSPGLPLLVITNPPEICFPATADLTKPEITAGSSPGLIFSYWMDKEATIQFTRAETAGQGTYYIKGTASTGFYSIKPVTVTGTYPPEPNAGPDQTLDFEFSARLDASLNANESGTWQCINGSALFTDITDPKTEVSNLSVGVNTLTWSVRNDICPAVADTLEIEVRNFTIPTLITPDMNGKNDFFVIRGIGTLGKSELFIFNRAGIIVYKSTDYRNDWNGTDLHGKPLPDDTYFYTLRSTSGKSFKGFIVVRRF